MASKKKPVKVEKVEEIKEEIKEEIVETPVVEAPVVETEEKPVEKAKPAPKKEEKIEKEPKYKIGSIVFVSREAEADLNGFKLFPQYKKYTYTVEAYDAISDVYTLRRLNLSLRLKEAFILAPEERAHDSLNRRQF
jgi:hypothetical protein